MLVAEVAEEAFQHIALLGSEEAVVVHLVQVAQVGKDAVGGCQLLVDVVEVGQQQLSPSIEVVEGLVDARLCGERAVQFAHQFDGVGEHALGMAAEEVADGGVGGAPDGLACQARQVVVEEQRGALVGEHDGGVCQVGSIFFQYVEGYVLKKRFHGVWVLTSMTLLSYTSQRKPFTLWCPIWLSSCMYWRTCS